MLKLFLANFIFVFLFGSNCFAQKSDKEIKKNCKMSLNQTRGIKEPPVYFECDDFKTRPSDAFLHNLRVDRKGMHTQNLVIRFYTLEPGGRTTKDKGKCKIDKPSASFIDYGQIKLFLDYHESVTPTKEVLDRVKNELKQQCHGKDSFIEDAFKERNEQSVHFPMKLLEPESFDILINDQPSINW